MKKYNQGVADSNRRRTRHGGAVRGKTSKLYMAWRGIKNRCLNPNSPHYHRYGGRGITMHPAWAEDFEVFKSDVEEAPEPFMTLDRIDNERGYEPGNVRWATRKEQANNRATNVYVTHQGKTKTLAEWADHFGWKYGLLRGRWNAGKRDAELFADPKWERNKTVTFNGETHTLREWADRSGVPYVTLYWRHKHRKPLITLPE